MKQELWKVVYGIQNKTSAKFFTTKELCIKYILKQMNDLFTDDSNYVQHSNGIEFEPALEVYLNSFMLCDGEDDLECEYITDDEECEDDEDECEDEDEDDDDDEEEGEDGYRQNRAISYSSIKVLDDLNERLTKLEQKSSE